LPLPRTYDAIFSRHRGRLPVGYLRALAKRESDLNPREAKDPAWGLMQIVPQVRESYNARFGTQFAKQDLLDPDTNVRIASELLNRIVAGYQRHPSRNLREDWSNPEFVKLVTAGWNSGYSEAGGVGKVATWLENRGLTVTHDSVFRHAAAAGATKHLQNAVKQAWQRSVSDLFFRDGGPQRPGLLWLAIGGVSAFAIYRWAKG